VSDRGKVYATGNNPYGTLGLPGLPYALRFSKVHTVETAVTAKVFAGGDQSFVLLDPVTLTGDEDRDIEGD